MKYGCSLEMVNILTSGPCAFTRQSKKFWVDYFKYIAAVGFKGIELPFNCFSSDAMAFETGRSGIPCNARAIRDKYGSPEAFLNLLNEYGIESVTSVHVNANDAMLEMIAAEQEPDSYEGLFRQLCMEGLDHAQSLHAEGLIISPTPELGWIERYYKENMDDFQEKTVTCIREVAVEGKKRGIQVAVKNEFWSLFRGDKIEILLQEIPELYFAPDLAHLEIAGSSVKQLLKIYRDRISCFHMSDTSFNDPLENYKRINAELPVQGPQKVFSDCGEGSVDIISALQILKENGYEGWVVCENKRTLDVYRGLLKLGWYVNQEIAKKL